MDVEVTLQILEIDATETDIARPKVLIMSHWNRGNYVRLQFPKGKVYTMNGNDLIIAIEKAMTK